MKTPTDLSSLSQDELKKFLDSFDTILFDVDGVIYNVKGCFPGVAESYKLLKHMGKKIKFVTNNTLTPRRLVAEKMRNGNVMVDENDVFTPTRAIIHYLKGIDFQKKLYVIGMIGLRSELEAAGLKISNSAEPDVVPASPEGFYNSFNIPKDVGAVLCCLDFNMTAVALNKAVLYLEDPEIEFIGTGTDTLVPNFKGQFFMGPGFIQNLLKDLSKRTVKSFGKPSKDLMDYLKAELNLEPSRTLFVGDSLEADIPFGNQNGLQTLLVFSGGVNPDDLKVISEEGMPDYCINSFGDLHKIVNN